jgi:restriction endonuclease
MKLFYFFIFENKKSLFDGLSDLHFRKFLKLKSLKIEIYDGKIFLNCYTINKLITQLQVNRRLKHDHLHQLMMNLSKLSIVAKNTKPQLGETEMKLSKIVRQNTLVSNIHHYTYKYDTKHLVHSTSNVPANIEEFQKVGPAIPNMVKENSRNPGSI